MRTSKLWVYYRVKRGTDLWQKRRWHGPRPLNPVRWWQSRRFDTLIHDLVVYTLLGVLTLVFLFPFFWMITSALKPDYKIFLWPPSGFRTRRSGAISQPLLPIRLLPFPLFFRNTLFIEVGMIAGRLISCVLIAYGFARLEAPGKDTIFAILLATLMLPDAVTWIPRYILLAGWVGVNTYLPLIVPPGLGRPTRFS